MAISRPMARLLLSEQRARPFQGSVLQLGRQAVLFSERELSSWASHEGVKVATANGASRRTDLNGERPKNKPMSDEEFFRFLGFDGVFSCDVSTYENPSMILDLNVPVPSDLHNRFDVIYDGGTMEHVFNVPAVLANIHVMLKRGGRVVHVSPASNMVDHGFYCFSPTFFADYYKANQYQLLTLNLFECASWTGHWKLYDCLAGGIDNRLGRVCTSKMSGVFCVAEKKLESKVQIFPSQGHFSRLWSDLRTNRTENGRGGLKTAIRTGYPGLAELFYRARALAWKTVLGRRSAMPPFLGRF
jgi:hypothetical protein